VRRAPKFNQILRRKKIIFVEVHVVSLP